MSDQDDLTLYVPGASQAEIDAIRADPAFRDSIIKNGFTAANGTDTVRQDVVNQRANDNINPTPTVQGTTTSTPFGPGTVPVDPRFIDDFNIGRIDPQVDNLGFRRGPELEADNAEVERQARVSEGIGTLDLEAVGTGAAQTQNPLNGYMNVTYHLRFSMVPYQHVEDIQRTPLGAGARVDPYVFTISSTGGNQYVDEDVMLGPDDNGGVTIRHKFPYYAINKLNFTNTIAPTAQNPTISTMVEMKITMVQPYGFSLHKDILFLAKKLEYPEITPGRIIYKLDIWWSGFDQDTGQWAPRIPVIGLNGETTDVISYFVTINTMEASPNAAGTQYEMTLSPMQVAFAYRPEVIVADAMNVTVRGGTFGGFLDDLADKMGQSIKDATGGIITPKYEFIAPRILTEARFEAKTTKTDVTRNVQGEQVIQFGKDTDLFTILFNAMSDFGPRQELFLAERNNDMFTTPRVSFTVRLNTIYGQSVSAYLNDYDKVTYQYIIEPFITFKTPTINTENFDKIISPDAQLQRVQEMVKYRMIVRRYDYFLTGNNTEIIEFAFKYNAFYQIAMSTPNAYAAQRGQTSVATASQTAEEIKNEANSFDVKVGNMTPDQAQAVQTNTKSLLGGGTVGEGATVSNTYQGLQRTPQNQGTNSHVTGDRQQDFLNAFDFHHSADMMIIEHMAVRGDPLWLVNDYSATAGAGASFFKLRGDNEAIRPQTAKCVLIRAFAPEQDAYMDPQRQFATVDTSTLGGFYEIWMVDTEFSEGKFTQNLKGNKLVHLNFIDKSVIVGKN